MIPIGERLREARNDRSLNLRQLAEQTGLSASMLCTIENGKTMPSVQSLAAIARALGLPLGFFFGEAATAPASNDSNLSDTNGPVVFSRSRKEIHLDGGITWFLLTPTSDPRAQFSEISYRPGASSGMEFYTHSGKEWGHVVEGELQVDLGFDSHRLGVGDSIMFDSQTPHRLSNVGSGVMRAIWVNLQ